jgi:beta-ribofuranosylaminobenzene 5'-phosphate synthase
VLARPLAVRAPARLHCALLNESGDWGRIDGGIGLVVKDPTWEIEIAPRKSGEDQFGLQGELKLALGATLSRFREHFSFPTIRVSVQKSIPLHAGLGSKTSLLMGISRGICELLGLNWSAEEIAAFTGRGGTSGIGINATNSGGFVWDVGRRFPSDKDQFLPSSVASSRPSRQALSLKAQWLKVVHFRFAEQGLHGATEVAFFQKECPVDGRETEKILALVAGSLIPSVIDQDFVSLQSALSEIQNLGLKKAEWRAQAPVTINFRDYFHDRRPDIALGLSSTGPTMFCVCLDRDVSDITSIVREFSLPAIHFNVTTLY